MSLAGMLVDFKKVEAAGAAIADSASREIVQEIIPVLAVAVQTTLDAAQNRIDASLGNALDAITAERMETVNAIHALLDRLNGTKLVLTAGGFEIQIPERPQ